jgi:hypothetical protein
MQVHLGLWDAGDADTQIGTVDWAGGYTDLTAVPFTSYVKSVRISPNTPCASYSYGDRSGRASSIMCGNATAVADGAGSPQQVNGTQITGSDTSTGTTAAAPGEGTSTAGNGTVYITVLDPECGCMKTHTSGVPVATGSPASNANVTVPYTAPASPTGTGTAASSGSAMSSVYPGAGSRATPFGGVVGLLGVFLL